MEYQPQKIEKRWQKYWQEKKIFRTNINSLKKKFYLLDMFPYPSGEGLHVGHPKGYIASDILAHYYHLNDYEVLHPMGWDAFGLPTENYALKTGQHPAEVTKKNIVNFKKQLQKIGLSYDWEREINTTDPNYYKWTQWIFLKLFEQGLAYQAEVPINFCSSCKTGLANEEVIGGSCERCKTPVERRKIRQWLLKITAYADRLLEDLKNLDWPEPIKLMQENWIGRSEGAKIKFEIRNPKSETNSKSQISNSKQFIEVFTTRADTLFGCTYLVVSPEKAQEWGLENEKTKKYINEALNKLDRERQAEEKEKTGIFSGKYAINPVNNNEIPIFIADYVLSDYGTGAIMAVPAHDKRDYLFAHKFGLPIKEVIVANGSGATKNLKLKTAYIDDGTLINSGRFDGMSSKRVRKEITQWLKEKKRGDFSVNYKLRDWVFSRQRYWGEPIPLVFCANCKKQAEIRNPNINYQNEGEELNPGWIAIQETELPLVLPKVKKYQPTGTGESPLATIKEWVETKCPKCSGPAKRETNTMPQWAGSCWYYLAYIVKQNSKFEIRNSKLSEKWLPVDWYIGGAEHAVLHLLYSRFWHKFLYDLGVIASNEPFQKLRNVGLILAEDKRKMSKSFGNVINPDEVIDYFGADCFRLYEMFLGPFEETASWQTKGINGIERFLKKFWKNLLVLIKKNAVQSDEHLASQLELLIQKVTQSIKKMHFNVAIAAFMEFNHLLFSKANLSKSELEKLLIIFAPFAPHFCEELWQVMNKEKSVFQADWPRPDKTKIKSLPQILIVQINGKLRGTIKISNEISEKAIKEKILSEEKFVKLLADKKIIKTIYIAGKLINFVIE